MVTGAAGVLGETICRQRIERGDQAREFVLPNDPAIRFVPREAQIVEGDLTDTDLLERFFQVADDMVDESILLRKTRMTALCAALRW